MDELLVLSFNGSSEILRMSPLVGSDDNALSKAWLFPKTTPTNITDSTQTMAKDVQSILTMAIAACKDKVCSADTETNLGQLAC